MPKYMEMFYGVKSCSSNLEETIKQVSAMYLMRLGVNAVSGFWRKQGRTKYLISFCEACCLCRSILWSSLLMLACKLSCKKWQKNETISSSGFIWHCIQTTHKKKVWQIHTLANKVKVASCIESISVKSESSVPWLQMSVLVLFYLI